MRRSYIPILTIAGSDCSGGAGIQADLKTISALGCYGMSVITSLTAQNTTGVFASEKVEPDFVKAQIEAVWSDIPPMAVKTGMLYDCATAEAVIQGLERFRPRYLVVDPVMVSTSGYPLLSSEACDLIKSRLFPLATLVTPNKSESEVLTGETDVERQSQVLREMGCRNFLIKGGDSSNTTTKTDYLWLEGSDECVELKADAVLTENTHGTGCTLSSAIACYLALGFDMVSAVSRGKLYVTRALEAGAKVRCGHGHGPVNHLFAPRHMKYYPSKYGK